MNLIFEKGYFKNYTRRNLDEAMLPVLAHSEFELKKPMVFISHKHEDLEELKGLLGFFEDVYDVKVYIDSNDSTMPKVTSAETASKLKNKIKNCDKFVLLATDGAVESKWCNWELGYGDAHKFKDNIALVPMKNKNLSDAAYKGAEYLELYPHIVYYNGTEQYSNGAKIAAGYYVRVKKSDGECSITPLRNWLYK